MQFVGDDGKSYCVIGPATAPRLRFTITCYRLRSSTCSEDIGDLMETALATYAILSKNLKEDDDEV